MEKCVRCGAARRDARFLYVMRTGRDLSLRDCNCDETVIVIFDFHSRHGQVATCPYGIVIVIKP